MHTLPGKVRTSRQNRVGRGRNTLGSAQEGRVEELGGAKFGIY